MSNQSLLDIFAITPVLFGAWGCTTFARVLMPRILTWFYRYLVVHLVIVMIVGASQTGLYYWLYFLLTLHCTGILMYNYFEANKPDDGIMFSAVLSAGKKSLDTFSGLQRPSVGDEREPSTTLQRGKQIDLARAADIDLGIVGTHKPSLRARGKLWLYEFLFKAQEKTLAAKRKVNEEATQALRSHEQLQEAIERALHVRAKPVIGDRVRDEFKADEDERAIRQRERDERAAEQDRKAKEAQGRREATEAQIEFDRRRREARLAGEVIPSVTAEDRFRQRAEQIAKYGSTGRFMPIAEELRAKLIAERGGEEHLTEEDLNKIELIFAEARRLEESKS